MTLNTKPADVPARGSSVRDGEAAAEARRAASLSTEIAPDEARPEQELPHYEPPTLTRLGTLAECTQGRLHSAITDGTFAGSMFHGG